MFVAVLSRKLVKPCQATPSHLRKYKISLIDELNPSMYMPRILYFNPPDPKQAQNICLQLQESLSQVLTKFYPLAGRYNKLLHEVDCNDEGAEYYEAQVDCELAQFLSTPGPKMDHIDLLLPRSVCEADEPTDPMLAVQINRFQCGGLAVAVFVAHRIFDSASLGIFLKAWANAATKGGLVITPDFDSPLHFPPENLPALQFQHSRIRDKSIVVRRFMFDKHVISGLRQLLTARWKSAGNQRPPSRVVMVSSVMTQALLRADRVKHAGNSRASVILQAINVRQKTIPPVHEHSCGTWASLSSMELGPNETRDMETDFPAMASRMRDTVVQGVKDCAKILSDKEFGRWVLVDSYAEAAHKAENPDYKILWMTDWSKFGEYDLDFGFGKPVWVSLLEAPLKDMCVMMNTKDNDGIEAWLFLHHSDMAYIDQDLFLTLLTSSKLQSNL